MTNKVIIYKENIIKNYMTDIMVEDVIKRLKDSFLNIDIYDNIFHVIDNEQVNDLTDNHIDNIIKIYCDDMDNTAIIKVYNKTSDNGFKYSYSKHVVLNTINNKGNCIDDFIHRAVEPLIHNIDDLVYDILSREPERTTVKEYHNTACYEKDFAQICFIKKEAKKIVENCERHLEKICEFYTRITK